MVPLTKILLMKHVAGAIVKFGIDRIKCVYFNGLLKELWVKLWLKLLQYNRILACLHCLISFLEGFKNLFLLFATENLKHKGRQNSE